LAEQVGMSESASWIADPIADRLPGPLRGSFQVVQLATDALDQVRREVWNQARRAGQDQLARRLKGARYALWKNPGNLTARQRANLSMIQHTNRRLYRTSISPPSPSAPASRAFCPRAFEQ
jgi:hypothetical protein